MNEMSNIVCAEFTAQIGTGKVLKAEPEHIQLAAEQTALIVIDMQNAYTSLGGYLDLAGFDVSKTKPVVENIKRRLMLHTVQGFRSSIFKMAGIKLRRSWWSRLTKFS